jgi:N-acetylglucosamine kinase-like BadF-type ATPase
MTSPPVAVLAVDGGNSKVDVALVARDGTLLATARGPTISHQQTEPGAGMARLQDVVRHAMKLAEVDAEASPIAEVGLFCLAGADSPKDVRLLDAALRDTGLVRSPTVLNDTRAGLRAGSDRGWGVIVICGAGVNCSGVAPDGRVASLAGLGPISGDWGGGGDVGRAALAAAVRARDGRGRRTTLERSVPMHFGLARPLALTQALYEGRIDESRLRELAPTVFAAAANGDAVSRGILDRLADELATMAVAIIRRLRLARTDLDVVLAGGMFQAADVEFLGRLGSAVHRVAPGAHLVPLLDPPLLGAALLGLEQLDGRLRPASARRLRDAFAARTSSGSPRRRPSA